MMLPREEFMQIGLHKAIKSPITGDAMGEHDGNRNKNKRWIDAHSAGEEEVERHEECKECRGSGAKPDDEPEPNSYLAEHDRVGPGVDVGEHGALEK